MNLEVGYRALKHYSILSVLETRLEKLLVQGASRLKKLPPLKVVCPHTSRGCGVKVSN